MLKHILKYLAVLLVRYRLIQPFVHFYKNVIKTIHTENPNHRSFQYTILALLPDRFRGDLEILADCPIFRVLTLPTAWQFRILNLFWKERPSTKNYMDPSGNRDLIDIQRSLRSFLKPFLKSLYQNLKVDCVVGASINYLHNYDWGMVSEELGIPYVILHRENLATNPRHQRRWFEVAKENKRFPGTHVVVHNQTMKDLFVKSGYVTKDEISALGALRMDKFVCKIKSAIHNRVNNHRITLFSFTYGTGLARRISPFTGDSNIGFRKLFANTHGMFARQAMEFDDVEFVIKAKWGGNWVEEIDRALDKYGLERSHIPNLRVTWDADAHDLILNSDVVCGFGSTTLLEAAIAGKPVIVPHFDEAENVEYAGLIPLRNYYHLFDVAESAESFGNLIVERMKNPEVPDACMKDRYALFEEYVSSMNGDALEKYTRLIVDIVEESRRERERIGNRSNG